MRTNDRLRAARLDRGWLSQEKAAEEISTAGRLALGDPYFTVSVRTYRRWESDRPGWPRPDTAAALRAAFGLSPEHLGFAPPPGHPVRLRPAEEGSSMERRSFLAAGSVAALSIVSPADLRPRDIDPALVGYFYQQLDGHYAADMMLGPRDLIGTVAEQYRLISNLSRAANGPVREELLQVGVTYAVLAAWLHQDAGLWDSTAYWHGIAQSDAQMTGNADLTAYAVSNMARLRIDLADGRAAVDLCRGGLGEGHRLSDRIRVNILNQQAHGHSLLGERAAVDRTLDEASRTVVTVDPSIPWGAAHRNSYFFEVQRATCYGRMGLQAEARRIWDRINADMPPAARRDTGVYLARQAAAYAATGEPEHAVTLAAESAEIAAQTRSARHRKELETLRESMSRWRGDPIGDRLVKALGPLTA
ncbi:helix-turn-helix transcriptional regulator [Streptomyces yaizuensis]|uniref:Helix-turn-helix domain-containing protein n=1 Tax=Streptomyces yaizuensis TaxID=2989713 RepID=A0ABQ5P1Y4_9ACTN|nr:helix-turn-helix transcriptional regulator [Streptomyces sp. YSPA8]GLF96517.1 helix-turn-helix domain-containing protein [Streptomyces sp. YSPA8]